MTLFYIPVNPVPAQGIAITLGGQNCVISLEDMNNRQYLSMSVNGNAVCQGVLVQSGEAIINAAYLGFVGEIAAVDTSGQGNPPTYEGWGSIYALVYNDFIP